MSELTVKEKSSQETLLDIIRYYQGQLNCDKQLDSYDILIQLDEFYKVHGQTYRAQKKFLDALMADVSRWVHTGVAEKPNQNQNQGTILRGDLVIEYTKWWHTMTSIEKFHFHEREFTAVALLAIFIVTLFLLISGLILDRLIIAPDYGLIVLIISFFFFLMTQASKIGKKYNGHD